MTRDIKVKDDISVAGGGRMPKSLKRDVVAPTEKLENPIAARVQELLVLNPGVVEFRVGDLKNMDDKTLTLLLKDIEEALDI
jgi:hypothetical protein